MTVRLAPRAPTAWRVVALFEPAPSDGTVITASTSDENTRIEARCVAASRSVVRVAIPERCAYGSMSVNGKNCAARIRDGCVEADVDLPKGTSVVDIGHPPIYRIADDVVDFPFFEGRKCSSAIVIRQDAAPAERLAAERLSRYFQYYFAHRENPAFRPARLREVARPEHRIPVVGSDHDLVDANLILIGQPTPPPVARVPNRPKIEPPLRGVADVLAMTDGRRALVLSAITAADLEEVLSSLLAKLDTRYPF